MLADAGMSAELWAKAMRTFTHKKNALRGRTPHQLWHEPKGQPFIFIGYKLGHRAYRLYLPSTRKVTNLHHVVFVESEFPAPSLTGGVSAAPPALTVNLHIVAPHQDGLCASALAPPPRQHAVHRRSPSLERLCPRFLTTPTPLPRERPAFDEPSLPSPAQVRPWLGIKRGHLPQPAPW
jgi:hypothetical protein